MYLLTLFLPLLGSIFTGFFGNFFGSKGSLFLCCFSIGLCFLNSCFIFYEIVLSNTYCIISLGSWISVGDLNIDWSFLFDSLTSLMFIVVTFISFMVHLFSLDYMKYDAHKIRFFSYLSLFTFFMLFLVSSNNFLQMFVGWEGVGLCSYLLVNFWFTRIQANKASLKAIIVNRFGDFGIYMALMSLFYVFSSLDYSVIFSLTPYLSFSNINFFGFIFFSYDFICFFLFLGVIGKSAQLGLHTWLPDAMEGPTPVSALIHAATMVTAGIFLVVRTNVLFEYSPKMLFILCIWGASTSFFAASVGIFQNDLKKVIAYSTCSQLGYMLFCCGLSFYSLSFFHLFNHAFFKALLFLSAGSVIHAMFDEQDMRKYGSLINYLPFTYVMFFIASFSLMALPFLTGFYSKDVILEFAFCYFSISGVFVYWLGLISALFTSIYSFRLFYLTFYSRPNFGRILFKYIQDSSYVVILCFSLLAFFSIFIGYLTKEIFLSWGVLTWDNIIFLNTFFFNRVSSEFLAISFKMLPFFFSILGMLGVFFSYTFLNHLIEYFYFSYKSMHDFLLKKWFIDDFFNKYFVDFVLIWSYCFNLKSLDKGLIEYFGPFGLSLLISFFSSRFSKLQSSFLPHYIFFFYLFLFFFVYLMYYYLNFSFISEEFFLLFLIWFFYSKIFLI